MKDGCYWFASERSSMRPVAQLIGGKWYLINEVGPTTLDEIERRGWKLLRKCK